MPDLWTGTDRIRTSAAIRSARHQLRGCVITWFKVDDKLHGHPKWTRCTAEAKALWTTAGAWSGSYNTDGIIRSHDLNVLAASVGLSLAKCRSAAANLVDNGMWRTFEDGWVFHGWTGYNPTKAQVKIGQDVEKQRRAVQYDTVLKAAVRLRDADRCCFCDVVVNFAARRGALAGRYDHTVPVSKGGKTTLDNVRVICDHHNTRKAGKLIEELPHDFPDLLEPWTVRHGGTPRLSPDLVTTESDSVGDSGRVGSGRDGSDRVIPRHLSAVRGFDPDEDESIESERVQAMDALMREAQ